MNILFLHGLESKLSNKKKDILESFGTVFSPDIDYKSNQNVIQLLFDEYINKEINVIIGSSLGGFAAFHLANSLGICALLFNPALPYRTSVQQNIPLNLPQNSSSLMRFVLGAQDDVIKAQDNLLFLAQNFEITTDYIIAIKNDLAHQIPVDVFETETAAFFDMLCY